MLTGDAFRICAELTLFILFHFSEIRHCTIEDIPLFSMVLQKIPNPVKAYFNFNSITSLIFWRTHHETTFRGDSI